MRLDLADGQWAEIKDPAKITRGQRKPVRAAYGRLQSYQQALRELSGAAYLPPPTDEEREEAAKNYILSEEEIDLFDAWQEPLTVAMVESWSFDEPVTIEGLNNLPVEASEPLIIHCTLAFSGASVDTESRSMEEDSPT